MRSGHGLSERQVVRLWLSLLSSGTELIAEDGQPIRVIYPGRANDDRGADFRDAVIASGPEVRRGDIEFHVRSSDWQAHHHDHNPAYDRVVLHVVARNDAGSPAGVPILVLKRLGKLRSNRDFSTPCVRAGVRNRDFVTRFLDAAGEERFRTKAYQFRSELLRSEAGQALYRGMMGALGYAKNKLPCWELAERVPLSTLESIARDRTISGEERLIQIQARLLGTAGLLPSQRPNYPLHSDHWIWRLELAWATSGYTGAMPTTAWNYYKVRPGNFPVRRIAAMSHLVLRYREEGLGAAVINMIKAMPGGHWLHRLEEGLVVNTDDYWTKHFDFGLDSSGKSPLLGNRRAAEMVVNIVLPFSFAWGQLTGQPELMSRAFRLYQEYPKLSANAMEKHMINQLRVSNRLINSARRQQGLIHVYKTLCIQGRCGECGLSQPEGRRHVQVQTVPPASPEMVVAAGGNHGGVIGA